VKGTGKCFAIVYKGLSVLGFWKQSSAATEEHAQSYGYEDVCGSFFRILN
jgi:hypothetical protein